MLGSKHLRYLVALAVVLTPALLSAFPEWVVDTRPECQQASDWVQNNVTSLPSDYTQISAFPVMYQRYLFDRLPPSQQAQVWRDKFSDVLSTRHLSPEARALLLEIRSELSAAYFAHHIEIAKNLLPRIESILSPEDIGDIFFQLGPDNGRLTRRTVVLRLRAQFVQAVSLLALPVCSCNSGYEKCQPYCMTCPSQYCCCNAQAQCTPTDHGCGLFWAESCDGRCFFNPCGL
jgi:hypothetical protein